MKLFFLLIAAYFGWMTICFSQTNQLLNYTLEDGLPQSQVYDIAQDEVGYLWLATQGGGVSRFNGAAFETFTEREGLPSNYVHLVYPQNDAIWVGTKKGLARIKKDSVQSIKGPQINTLLATDSIFFVGSSQGIYSVNSDFLLEKQSLAPLLDTAFIHDIIATHNIIWVATNKGLFKIDDATGKTQVTLYDTSHFTGLTQQDNNLYAATFMEGIVVISLDNSVQEKVVEAPKRINDVTFINQQLWISTDSEGVFVYDPETFQQIKRINKQTGLSVNHVREVFQDMQATTWMATSGGGLYRYSPNDFEHYNTSNGLAGNRVYAIATDKSDLYFSHSESGISKLDSLGIIKKMSLIDSISNVKIKALHIDNKSNMWIGSDGKGLLLRKNSTKDSVIIKGTNLATISIDTLEVPVINEELLTQSKGFPSDWIRSITSIQDTVWIATYSSGIVKMQYNNIKNEYALERVFGIPQGIEDVYIKTVTLDDSSRLWYGTQKGHIGFIKEGKVTHLGDVLQQATAINSLVFNKNRLYIGTAGRGVWSSSVDAPYSFKKLNGSKKLTSQNCYLLLFDREEQLWVGSERGVDKVALTTENEILTIDHYGRSEGFLGIETCLNATAMDAEGDLWFGALYGLTRYKKGNSTTEIDTKPKVDFTKILVNYNEPLLGYEGNGTTSLLPSQNTLSFYYKTVDLLHPNEVTYRYKIDDAPWSPWSKNDTQNIIDIAAGTHSFNVQSRDFSWNESEPISFPFTIQTPFYKETWFIFLSMLVIGSIITLFVLSYIKNLKRKNRKVQEQLALQNHLLTLEQKALRLQMNPHFIFNVLNGIKAMHTTDPQKMKTTINSFAMLLRGVLNNSRKDVISLEEEMDTLKKYLEVEQLMATHPFSYSITLDAPLAPEEILLPPMLLQPFVENAIKHGIHQLDKKGEIKIHFTTTKTQLKGEITDNGKGIFQTQKDKKTTHPSVALDVTKQRLQSLGGPDALVLSEIVENDVILGTSVRFSIPLQTEF